MDVLILLLPCDVFRLILQEWIGRSNCRDFVSLDTSMCNFICREKYYFCMNACEIEYREHSKEASLAMKSLESFLRWVVSRKLRVSELRFNTRIFQVNLISTGEFHGLKYLTLTLHQSEVRLNFIMRYAPRLCDLTLTGTGTLLFDVVPETAPVSLFLSSVTLHMRSIACVELEEILNDLGLRAKQLQSIDLEVKKDSYDDFFSALYHVHTMIAFRYCNFTSNEEESLLLTKSFSSKFFQRYDKHLTTKLLPDLQTLSYHGNEAILIPVLPHCPKLQTLQVQSSYFGRPYSDSFGSFLCSNTFPALRTFIAFGKMNINLVTILHCFPVNTFHVLRIVDCTDAVLAGIASNGAASLRVLTLFGGHCDPGELGLFHFQHIPMQYLKELHLEYVLVPFDMYCTFFTAQNIIVSFPVLTHLSICFASQDKIDQWTIFQCLLTSLLHGQLQWLRVVMNVHAVRRLNGEVQQSMDWIHTMPVWDRLDTLILDNVPLYAIDELLVKLPRLRTLHFHVTLFPEMLIQRVLRKETFQHAMQLQVFHCEVPTELSIPYTTWKEIFLSCPSLHTFLIFHWRKEPYWQRHNPHHQRLLQEFQQKIKFFDD